MNTHHFIIYISALLMSAAGAWAMGKYGHRLGLLDKPNPRSSHLTTTPKGGGIGILAAFVLASFTLPITASFWIAATGVSMAGLFADRYDISAMIRLISHFVASTIFLFGVWYSPIGITNDVWIMVPLAIFMVATTNYYNFMDGINGIAAITGTVGFGLLSLYAFSKGAAPEWTALSISVSLSCLGFLPFNIPKAKVFMGDIGAVLLGFLFSGLVIVLATNMIEFCYLASFLFPFYADELTTLVIRIKEGDKIWRPHRKHLYQLLANECGIAHWKISTGYGVAQLIVGMSVFFVMNTGVLAGAVLISIFFTLFVLFYVAVRKKVVYKSA